MTDYIDQDGGQQGYLIFNTEQGDKLFLKHTGNSQNKVGKDLSDAQITGRIIGGTGSLDSVEGDYQIIAKFNRYKEIIKTSMQRLRYKIMEKEA